jgi:lipid-binding SYLF domain-containing protein
LRAGEIVVRKQRIVRVAALINSERPWIFAVAGPPLRLETLSGAVGRNSGRAYREAAPHRYLALPDSTPHRRATDYAWRLLNGGRIMTKRLTQVLGLGLLALLASGVANADKYSDTEVLFRKSGESAKFFANSYAYALFPTVGEGAFIVGGARGTGHVYVNGQAVGRTVMTQLSLGFQAGGKAFSQIIFFRDKSALDQFESGSFEFSAGASAVAITAGASASVGTSGSSSGASGGEHNATTDGSWNAGMAVFTIAKGGLMYAANIAGQKFTYSEGTSE